MNLFNGKTSNIFVIFHFPFPPIESEIFSQITPNRSMLPTSPYIISADSGDEISNKNDFLAEYSTYYWVWKNVIKSDYVGFFQYRRYLNISEKPYVHNDPSLWSAEHLSNLTNNYDILLPSPITFNISIRDQYTMFHDSFYLDKFLELLSLKFPVYYPYFKEALTFNSGTFCNMFYMKWEYFNEYMSIIFPIFNDLEAFLSKPYQTKVFAYLGERIFNGYIYYLKSTKNPSIKYLDTIML